MIQNVPPLRELVTKYIEEYGISEKCDLPKTTKNKRESFKRFFIFLGNSEFNLESIRKYNIFLEKKGNKASTRQTELKCLKSFVHWLYVEEYIEKDWSVRFPKLSVKKKKIDIVSPEVAEQIIFEGCKPGDGDNSRNREIKKSMEIMMRLMLRTGLRFNEANGLSNVDLNFDLPKPIIQIQNAKGGDYEIIPCPLDMKNELLERMENKKLFKNTIHTCNLALKRGCNALGIKEKLTSHSLRHIFASSLLAQGVSLQQVSRLLRHSSVEITDQIYSHYSIEDLQRIISTKGVLTKKSATTEEMFNEIEQAIKNTGFLEGNQIEFIRNGKEFSFKMKICA
ncbi:tyrosine-type recombinase/integrase [Candidatus Roizmanbacteria bacterium]|nr:tyrosine-type recombinase/integrase [Candidatus Roizmanbacteria bacterium]